MKNTSMLFAGTLFLAALLPAVSDTINPGDFDYRAPVTFPGYTLSGSLANFPVLVRLTASDGGFSYATASADGSDIRFTLADGTILPSEVALWNPVGESQVWVSVPTLASDTSIMMYWGGTHSFPSSQTDGSVWTTAGYFGVWHMDEASGATTAKDSAGGALNGTYNVTSVGEAGVAGGSVRISNGGWNVADGKGITTAAYTGVGSQFMFSLWTKYPNQNPGTDRLASRKTDWQQTSGWEISTQRYNQQKIDFRGSGTSNPEPGVVLKNTSWQYLTFVFDGTTGTTYVNNSWKNNGTINAVVDNDNALVIGNMSHLGGDSFKGWMDEVRLYRGVPAREWISTEYNSVHDTAFAAVGAREALATDEPIPGTLAADTVNPHDATLAWNLVGAGSSATEVRIAYGTEAGVYTVTNVVASALTAPTSATATLSGLHCGTAYYAQLTVENASGAVSSDQVSFTTTGVSAFSDASISVENGTATASATLSSPVATATVAVDCLFGRSADTPSVLRSWTAATTPETFTATQSGLLLGTYAAHFEATSTCSVCGNVLTATSETVTTTFAGDCRWTGAAGDNLWNNPQNWSSGTVPGGEDTAIFGSEASVSGATIALGAAQAVKVLRVESAGALTIGTADDKSAGYTLGAAHLSRTGEDAGQLAFAGNFVFTAPEDGTNTLVAAAAVRFNGSCGSATRGLLLKTGTATVTLAASISGNGPAFIVREGELSATAVNSLHGSATVGGGETAARLTFTRDDVLYGSGVGTLSVLTNGTAQIRKTDWGHFYSSFVVRDGGSIACNDYTYVLNARLCGSTITCNNGNLYASGYWQQGITSEASDLTSWLRGGMTFNPSDPSGSTAVINVADGAAPVDLVITRQVIFSGGETSKTLEKSGAGTLRMTGTSGVNTTATIKLNAGTLLCDNTSGTPLGNAPLRVYGGATLGGCGFVGGTARGNVTVAGSSTKIAAVAPGSIDETTGAHLLGTLTVGTEEQSNAVTFGDYSKLAVSIGAGGVCDSLRVYGTLDLSGSSDTLQIAFPDSSVRLRAGRYVLASATEGITGSFDTVSSLIPSAILMQTANEIALLYMPGTVLFIQ